MLSGTPPSKPEHREACVSEAVEDKKTTSVDAAKSGSLTEVRKHRTQQRGQTTKTPSEPTTPTSKDAQVRGNDKRSPAQTPDVTHVCPTSGSGAHKQRSLQRRKARYWRIPGRNSTEATPNSISRRSRGVTDWNPPVSSKLGRDERFTRKRGKSHGNAAATSSGSALNSGEAKSNARPFCFTACSTMCRSSRNSCAANSNDRPFCRTPSSTISRS